jgi:hypothetical protein
LTQVKLFFILLKCTFAEILIILYTYIRVY